MAEEVCYGLAQEYLFNVGLKMGTFKGFASLLV
ncbi:hypothetical protein LTSEJOH_6139, partial [Salmonella enterica subsp. enterica serovar Johannesburg str. S5-703]